MKTPQQSGAQGLHHNPFLHTGCFGGIPQPSLGLINVAAVPRVVLEPLKQVRNGCLGSFDRELLEGIVLELRTIKERFRLIDAIFEQGEGWPQQGAEVQAPALVAGSGPTPFGPKRRQFFQKMVRCPAVQNLGIQPVELVPVETRPGFVDPIETKNGCGLTQAKPFLHALRHGPPQQGHVVGDGVRGVAHGAEVVDGGHPIPF